MHNSIGTVNATEVASTVDSTKRGAGICSCLQGWGKRSWASAQLMWAKWTEDASQRRMRYAREHVRKLIAGENWQAEEVAKLTGHGCISRWAESPRCPRCCLPLLRLIATSFLLPPHEARRLPYAQTYFIYPQRLWYTAILSATIQLFLTLAFALLLHQYVKLPTLRVLDHAPDLHQGERRRRHAIPRQA